MDIACDSHNTGIYFCRNILACQDCIWRNNDSIIYKIYWSSISISGIKTRSWFLEIYCSNHSCAICCNNDGDIFVIFCSLFFVPRLEVGKRGRRRSLIGVA